MVLGHDFTYFGGPGGLQIKEVHSEGPWFCSEVPDYRPHLVRDNGKGDLNFCDTPVEQRPVHCPEGPSTQMFQVSGPKID